MTADARPTDDDTDASPKAVTSRIYYFDYLRLIATVSVVTLHAASPIFTRERHGDVSFGSAFDIANVYSTFGRVGVDLFFLMSGALLLDPRRRFKAVKQIRRVAVPLAVWTAIYLTANVVMRQADVRGIQARDGALVDSFGEGLTAFVHQPLAYHLWFVYVLLGLYLVVPLVRPITATDEPARGRLLVYALGLWLVFDLLVSLGPRVWDGFPELYTPAFPDFPTAYLGIFLLGFVLHHYRTVIPGPAIAFVGAALAGLGVMYLITAKGFQGGDGNGWAYGNLGLMMVLTVAAILLAAQRLLDRPGRAYGFVSLFSLLSFRIYLVHALVIHVLRRIDPLGEWSSDHPLAGIPVIVVLTLVISFAFAWAVEQVKPLRQLL